MFLRFAYTLACLGSVPGMVAAEPIHEAAARGDAEAVQSLLDEGTPVDLFDTTDSIGRPNTALFRAAMAGRTEVVEVLLDAGADPTLRPDDSRSVLNPLQVAAKFGRTDILQMFIDRGADPDAPGKEATALHVAMKSEKGEVVRLLLDSGASMRVEQPSIASKLATGNPDRGQKIFESTCQYCHRVPRPDDVATGKDRVAGLWNVVGRDIASLDGTIYSEAMKAVEGVWTYDKLNSFIALPGGYVPGTMMEYYTHYTPPDEQERIDLISYLRSLSDDPQPFP